MTTFRGQGSHVYNSHILRKAAVEIADLIDA